MRVLIEGGAMPPHRQLVARPNVRMYRAEGSEAKPLAAAAMAGGAR